MLVSSSKLFSLSIYFNFSLTGRSLNLSPANTSAAAAKPQSSWSAIVAKTTISSGDNDDDRRNNDNNNIHQTIIPPLPLLHDTSPSIEDEGYTTTHTTATATPAISTTMSKSQTTQIIIPSQQYHPLRRSATTNATVAKVVVSTIPNINRTFHRYDSAPLSSSTTTELDNIVHTIHQHSKLDCPTNNDHNIVYSCLVNGCTPLGMEYISDLIIVTNLDYLVTTGITTAAAEAAAITTTTATTLVEYVSRIIVKLNQANLEYNQTTATTTVGGGSGGGNDTERSYFASSQMIAITVKQHNNQPRLQYVHTKVVVVEVMGMIILSLSVFGGDGIKKRGGIW